MKNKKKLKILYEDKYIIAVSKPFGLLSISTEKEKDNTLYKTVSDYVKKQYPKNKIFVVHRLDRETSGIVLFAKDRDIAKKIQNKWDKVIRKYYAIVEGRILESGTIKTYLNETKNLKTYVTNDSKNGKLAITEYRPVKKIDNNTLVEINIKTGRKNQIRVQMASIGHPIVGDKKYNFTRSKEKRMYLQEYLIEFKHPIYNKVIKIEEAIDFNL